VALSGGLDSGVLLAVAALVLSPARVLALTVTSEIVPQSDLYRSVLLAASFGVRHLLVPFEPLALQAFRENPPDRCYHCKLAMYQELLAAAYQEGFRILADGTILEDFLEDRPGFKAIYELEVVIPLAEAAFYKRDVRALWRALGLPDADRPASPCLATRFPPGEPITSKKVQLVRKAEDFLRSLGFDHFRLRMKGFEARLEMMPEEETMLFRERAIILSRLKELGFEKVFFDLEGYIPPKKRRP